METVPREEDEGANKTISDIDEEALPLEEGDKKVSRKKTV